MPVGHSGGGVASVHACTSDHGNVLVLARRVALLLTCLSELQSWWIGSGLYSFQF